MDNQRVIKKSVYLALLGLVFAVGTGCTRIHTEKGVESTWREPDNSSFTIGSSTQSDVLAALGPPSQIIRGSKGQIFYYLHEKSVGQGVVFIVYNQGTLNTTYDRAVFFFDATGVLEDYAYSGRPGEAEPP